MTWPHPNKGKKYFGAYKSWAAMMARCMNSSNSGFKDYGGRGIAVCDRWRDFRNFLADMGARPPGTTLGRIDNDGNYEPGNCRWETHKEQALNKHSPLTLSTYQRRASKYDFACDTKGKLWYYALGLVGESGEVADKIKKHYRDTAPVDVIAVKRELGDVLWYVGSLARHLGIDLRDVGRSNLEKLERRARLGRLGGSGDDR